MAVKLGNSPKTDRAKKTAKKGAVRQHAPKRIERPVNTGLLDDLHRSSLKKSCQSDPSENLKKVTALVCNELGTQVTAMVVREEWQPAVRPLVCAYVKSLVMGDGTKPAELSSYCARLVYRHFVEICTKRIVGDDILPGQRQDWYMPALNDLRESRRKSSRPKKSAQPSPSPLVFAKKDNCPSKQLQPTG